MPLVRHLDWPLHAQLTWPLLLSERVFPPATCLEGEAGNLRSIILHTQILSRFWYIPEQGQGPRNVQLKPCGRTHFV